MPGPVETQPAAALPGPDGAAPLGANAYGSPAAGGANQPTAKMVYRDLAGHVIERAPRTGVDDGCGSVAARAHAAGTELCGPYPMPDPTSVGPIGGALIGGILIICGALTFIEQGPGKLIRPRPRRKGATRRAQRWRRRIGVALVVVGFFCVVRGFV